MLQPSAPPRATLLSACSSRGRIDGCGVRGCLETLHGLDALHTLHVLNAVDGGVGGLGAEVVRDVWDVVVGVGERVGIVFIGYVGVRVVGGLVGGEVGWVE